MVQDKIYIYGKHALTEALKNRPKAVKKVFLAPQMDDPALRTLVKESGVHEAILGAGSVPQEAGGASHQGVVAVISQKELMVPYDEFVEGLVASPDTALVLLNELQDPHNVGAVIRSAAAFGIAGVLIPEHDQAPVTGAVVKVSAGMAFRVPLVAIGNTNHTLRDLKERGFWVYGLAGEGSNPLTKEAFTVPTVFVLGNEARGIREKTRELCDVLISIPMHPRCESLNAAASMAVTLSTWSAQHPTALTDTL
ncbi:MAG: 23S rRNA (guanosine(2251)-2'-O)-methyltransferase RlmB [Candidatus Yonathbacteria bacterium RIFOXYD1_FULL_52_36]|uniref:23S rRNA (Guanosine(2251)-2'-O)-methyltransferase RlmB n=1 Tax=Candidatus Yonathbacteria bacterium RIFOXYD1_FULL_52_36 TaxID=1802730 RepID=A0A1G2SN10_9BACT|nr:MAG: 23S rRNA (guanosine(2251)-2'-O)-methyltransferase RlmB [Candidatus Yonathbacteria bacterium RIFOXYD1_FULL_52_36]